MRRTANTYLAIFTLAVCLGCVNPYVQFYKDRTNGQKPDPKRFQLCDEPIDVFQGTDPQRDTDSLNEDGYFIVGYSNYNGARDAGREAFLEQARKVNACRVLFYDPKHTGSRTGSMSTYIPGPYVGMAVTTPIVTERYDYLVTYWIKLRPEFIRLGLNYRELTSDERSKLGSNRGVMVSTVMKGTPAFRADILKGDIIRSVGGKSADDMKTFASLLDEFAGQSVAILINRGGGDKTIQVQLNPNAK